MGFQDIRDIIDEAKEEPTVEKAATVARKAIKQFADIRIPKKDLKAEIVPTKIPVSVLSRYARQIVDAGRREIARKIHPDKQAGDNEEMIRLNSAAEWLKNLIEEAE